MTKEQAVAAVHEYYRSDIAREIVTAIEEDLVKDMTSNFNDSLLVRLGVAREAAVREERDRIGAVIGRLHDDPLTPYTSPYQLLDQLPGFLGLVPPPPETKEDESDA